MRILQINNFHYPRGGSDRYFLDIVNLLKDAGEIVGTFSTQHERNTNKEWMISPGVTGVDTNSSNITQSIRFFYSFENRNLIQQAIDVFKPDIAHIHIYYGQLTSSILRPLVRAGIPIVQTLHEYKTVCPTQGLYANGDDCQSCNGSQYWQAIVKRCNRGSLARSTLSAAEAYFSDFLGARKYIDHYIAVSNYQKDRLVSLGMQGKKISVIHNFAKTIAEQNGIEHGYLLFVGRLTQGKGLECLFHALSKLAPNIPPVHVVGEGILRPKLMELSKELGLKKKIIWRGFLSGVALSEEYSNSLAVINPSELNETFGLTVLEGMAAGRPVIAARSGAFPELIRHGVDGLLFPPGDSYALAQCIMQLVGDKSLRNQLAAAGRRRAQTDFGPGNHLKSLLKLYETTLDSAATKV